MKPKIHTSRNGLHVVDVNDTPEDVFIDTFLEDGENGFLDNNIETDKTKDYDIRIESIKRAIDIAKLMSNVTTEDIIRIANTVVDYICNTKI